MAIILHKKHQKTSKLHKCLVAKMITGNIIYHYNKNEELTNQMSCSIKMTDYLSFSFSRCLSVSCLSHLKCP